MSIEKTVFISYRRTNAPWALAIYQDLTQHGYDVFFDYLGNAMDWLRREIETALEARRNIVPLMLEGFDFKTPSIESQLTGKLSVLKRYNELSVPVEYFLEAMGRLREKRLNVALDSVPHPASASIASGDFERVTLENIRARAHFIVLLTPSALERCGVRSRPPKPNRPRPAPLSRLAKRI